MNHLNYLISAYVVFLALPMIYGIRLICLLNKNSPAINVGQAKKP